MKDRIVTVFNSATSDLKEFSIPGDVKTKGDLIPYLDEYKIDYSNKKMMDSQTEHVLETKDALLPEHDFTLVLTVEKVKSGGGLSYREAREFIRNLSEEDRKNHFKGWSNAGTDTLNEMIDEYEENSENEDDEILQDILESVDIIKTELDNIVELSKVRVSANNSENERIATKVATIKNRLSTIVKL